MYHCPNSYELNDIPDPSIIEIGQEIVIREAAPLPDLPPPPVTTDAPASEIPPEEDARWPFTVTSDQARLAALGTTALVAAFALFFILRAAILVIAGYGSRAGPDIAQRRTASGQSGADTSLIAADRNHSRGWLRRAFSALRWRSVAVLRLVAAGLRALPGVIGRHAARLRGPLRHSWIAARAGTAAALAMTARSSGRLRRSAKPLAAAAVENARAPARQRRRAAFRERVEMQAATASRIGLVEVAEQHFRSGLQQCEENEWDLEAGICLQGLAQLAEQRGDRDEAEHRLDRAAERFRRDEAWSYVEAVEERKALLMASEERAVPAR